MVRRIAGVYVVTDRFVNPNRSHVDIAKAAVCRRRLCRPTEGQRSDNTPTLGVGEGNPRHDFANRNLVHRQRPS
jgi:hypothetical protein